jgi:hypothetical protein
MVLAVLVLVVVLNPSNLALAFLVLLVGLICVGLFAALQHRNRETRRRHLQALAAAYRLLAG